MDIQSSPLSIRAINALTQAGYKTVEECQGLSERKLYSLKNLGKKSVLEIRHFCQSVKTDNPNASKRRTNIKRVDDTETNRDYYMAVLPIPVSQILFSVRVKNCLDKLKVKSIKDLVQITETRILDQKNAGKKSAKDILLFLGELDLKLGMKLSQEMLGEIDEALKSKKDPSHFLDTFRKLYPAKSIILDKLREQVIGIKRIEFYRRCFELYKQNGTLQSVAKSLKLTRERIRQILVKGTRYGLFKYSGYEYPFVSKESIIESYSKTMSLSTVAKSHSISTVYLRKLLTAYGVKDADLEKLRLETQKGECIELHKQIEAELGHAPSTTEMQRTRRWRYLSLKICRLWGSIEFFRNELNIHRPKRVLPEVSRLAFEKRRRLAFIVRMQNLDQIRECLGNSGPLSTLEISYDCGMKPPKTYRLLGMLMSTKEIVREGEGNTTKYRITVN